MLNDTRTRRRSGSVTLQGDDHERQFLVGSDEDDSPDQLYTAPTTAQPVLGDHETDTRRSLVLEQDVSLFSFNALMESHVSDDCHGPPEASSTNSK